MRPPQVEVPSPKLAQRMDHNLCKSGSNAVQMDQEHNPVQEGDRKGYSTLVEALGALVEGHFQNVSWWTTQPTLSDLADNKKSDFFFQQQAKKDLYYHYYHLQQTYTNRLMLQHKRMS